MLNEICILGLVHENFEVGLFLHQTTPPGPIRGSLKPFLILTTFLRVIQALKQLPSIRDTRQLQILSVPDAGEPKISGVLDTGESKIPDIPDTGDLFFYCFLHFSFYLQLGHQGFGNPLCPGRRGVEDSRCPGHRAVVF